MPTRVTDLEIGYETLLKFVFRLTEVGSVFRTMIKMPIIGFGGAHCCIRRDDFFIGKAFSSVWACHPGV